jgi:16S rRNA (uracil1498-N3)-methyltransferase
VHARFYAPDAHVSGERVRLPADEARHLLRVMRLRSGDAVRVFNGRGAEFDAVVLETARDSADVRLEGVCDPAPEPSVSVTLVQAVLKADKMDDVVRDAVMMGVAAVQPLVSTRSELTHAAIARGAKVERWQRLAVAAAKQCGRAVVPDVMAPLAFEAIPAAIADGRLPSPVLLFVEPGADASAVSIHEVGETPTTASVIVGPEGGWTAEELSLASKACRPVIIGARTLRADAMAIIALAALFAVWKEF